ncbi:MAG: hypothetical protein EBZ93_11090 [Actinobacteria bacterium]|nr:hypothetical protein [Actinomycetota bacterium]
MSHLSGCLCCEIASQLNEDDRIFPLGSGWSINSRVGHERPALVIQSVAHRERLTDLDPKEREELGRVLALATEHVERMPGVEKVYVSIWNENSPSHVHFHLIPRCVSDRGAPIGPNLEDRPVPELPNDLTSIARAISEAGTSSRQERSRLVRGLLRVCAMFARISMYRGFGWLLRSKKAIDVAEIYVMFWLLLWSGLFAVSAFADSLRSSATGVVIALIGLVIYRFLDMALFEIRIILEPTDFKSIPRGLVLRVLNLVEVMVAVAVLLQVGPGYPPAQSMLEGFRSATVQTNFSHEARFADAVVVGASAVSLMLLAGGVAMLLSKVSDKIRESPT